MTHRVTNDVTMTQCPLALGIFGMSLTLYFAFLVCGSSVLLTTSNSIELPHTRNVK